MTSLARRCINFIRRLRLALKKSSELLTKGDFRALFFAARSTMTYGRPGYTGKSSYKKWITKYDSHINLKRLLDHTSNPPPPSSHTTKFTFIIIADNEYPEKLSHTLLSLNAQTHTHWEANIILPPNQRYLEGLANFLKNDPRIRRIETSLKCFWDTIREKATPNTLVCVSKAGNIIGDGALEEIHSASIKNPKLKLIYTDLDHYNAALERHSPIFLPDWNVDLLYSNGLIHENLYFDANLSNEIHCYLSTFEPKTLSFEIALSLSEILNTEEICHLPKVLMHQPANITSYCLPGPTPKHLNALNAFFLHAEMKCNVEITSHGLRMKFPLPQPNPRVSIIIPTRNGTDLLERCINSIRLLSSYRNYEIIIIDNGSDDQSTLHYLQQLALAPDVIVLRDARPFNYSALNNLAVTKASGEYLCFLNNDTEVITPDWIEELLSHAARSDVGVVGCKLLYANNTIQHAGVVLGMGKCAGHPYRGFPRSSPGYLNRLVLTSNYSAVTGACMMIEKETFLDAGGFNETNLHVAFNDIDLCLRCNAIGYRTVWTPYAELYHHESVTRGADDSEEKIDRLSREEDYMLSKWNELIINDPNYSPNLSLSQENLNLAFPPRIAS